MLSRIVSIEPAHPQDTVPVTAYVIHGGDEVELRMCLFDRLRDHFGKDGCFFVNDFGGLGYSVSDAGDVIVWDIKIEEVCITPRFRVSGGVLETSPVHYVEDEECFFEFDLYDATSSLEAARFVEKWAHEKFPDAFSFLITPVEVGFSVPVEGFHKSSVRWEFSIEAL